MKSGFYVRVLASALFLFFAFAVPFNPCAAAPTLRAELIPEFTSVQSGKSFYVSARFYMPAGWHIYWKNSGDSGEPPSFNLSAGPNYGISSPLFQPPKRFQIGPMTEYGMEGVVDYVLKIDPAASPKKSDTVEIKGTAAWLACHQECVPGLSELTLKVPVSNTSSVPNPAFGGIMDKVTFPTFKNVAFLERGADLFLLIPKELGPVSDPYFYSGTTHFVSYSDPQTLYSAETGLVLKLKKTSFRFKVPPVVTGMLSFTGEAGKTTVNVEGEMSADAVPEEKDGLKDMISFIEIAFFSFLGGFLLNLMPCVFPVLSLKAFSLLEMNVLSKKTFREHTILYTIGVVFSFLLLAILLFSLREAGMKLGWGFQMQYPPFVLFLSVLMLLLGLIFSGVATVGESFSSVASISHRHEGVNSFLTGVLAVIVATPCAAPFMGIALGYALMHSIGAITVIFLAMGLGLASPFIFLAAFPKLSAILPKPGEWMVTFKEFLAFPLYATSAWLLWLLTKIGGGDAIVHGLVLMLLASFALWLYGGRSSIRKGLGVVCFLACVLLFAVFSFNLSADGKSEPAISFQSYSEDGILRARKEGFPVFVKITADWCLTCKMNEKVALSSSRIASFLKRKKAVLFEADWTNRNDEISEILGRYKRAGVPLYLLFKPGSDEPFVFPVIITEQAVMDAFDN